MNHDFKLYIRRWRETKYPLNNFTINSLSVEPGTAMRRDKLGATLAHGDRATCIFNLSAAACRRNSRLKSQVRQVAKVGSACQMNVYQSVADHTMTCDQVNGPLPLYDVQKARRSAFYWSASTRLMSRTFKISTCGTLSITRYKPGQRIAGNESARLESKNCSYFPLLRHISFP